jgi:drug/metabolite transporter (DMT)-like permease
MFLTYLIGLILPAAGIIFLHRRLSQSAILRSRHQALGATLILAGSVFRKRERE